MKPLTHAQSGSDHQWLVVQLTALLARWQSLVDDTKLQVHLGTRDVRDRADPLIRKMELDLRHAAAKLRQLAECDECERAHIHSSLEQTLQGLEDGLDGVRRGSEPRED